jgi:hypothetical protein
MGLFPEVANLPNPGFVTSIGMGTQAILNSTTVAVQAQNMIYLMPVRIETPTVFVAMGWLNGGTVDGQCAAGIYTLNGVRLDYTAHTTQTTTSVTQTAALTNANVTLRPGVYYFAHGSNSATATFRGGDVEINTARVAFGASAVASAYANPIPSSLTPAWPLTSARQPFVFASMTASQ